MKTAIAAAALLVVLIAWMCRFELIAPHSDSAVIYKLDRFTGTMYVVSGVKQIEVKTVDPDK